MSGSETIRMMELYVQDVAPTDFFTGMFQIRQGGIHMSEFVEIDIRRYEEDVAVVVQDLSTGYNINEDEKFTNKKFKPPIYKEAFAINAFDLINRAAGDHSFQDPDTQGKAIAEAFLKFRLIDNKIKRALEFQSSQVMLTGKLVLKNANGVAVYLLDFKPKATHFPTVGTLWSDGAADPIADLALACETNRIDGKSESNNIIMGSDAFSAFKNNTIVQKHLDKEVLNLGALEPQFNMRGIGATSQGFISINDCRLRIWTYSTPFRDPETLLNVKFMDTDKVIVMDSQARLDLTVGGIPRIVEPDSRVLKYLPPIIADTATNTVLFTNAWVTPDGEQLFVGAGSRPLVQPTAIDTYSCLTVL